MTRTYQLGKRAAKQRDTRRRIVEAAVDLHQTVGPARTTISAIAERAGVERLTVYRHFPTEEAIFAACSGHFEELHPFPDTSGLAQIPILEERLSIALNELFAYYATTEQMLESVFRDASEVPAMRAPVDRLRAAIDTLVRDAAGSSADRSLQVAVQLATSFDTWRLLVRRHGLDNDEAAAFMTRLVLGSHRMSADPLKRDEPSHSE